MSGGFNPINLVSQVALGVATGGASVWAQLAMQVVSSIGQQVIQQLGQQIGLPQSTIDMAQGAFAGAVGDHQGAQRNMQEAVQEFGQAFNASPQEIGDWQRQLQDTVRDIATQAGESEELKDARGGGGKGKSWLMAIAEVLGNKLNSMAHELTDLAQQAADDPASATLFGAKSQEFGILMNSANTGLKSIGEGLTSMAKRN